MKNSLLSGSSNFYRRKALIMNSLVNEIKDTYKVNPINIKTEGNINFTRLNHVLKKSNKLQRSNYTSEDKENFSSLINMSNKYQEEIKINTNHPLKKNPLSKHLTKIANFPNRVYLEDISNKGLATSHLHNYYRKIYTNESIEFYDEYFHQYVKLKKFKEDKIPFTHSSILPSIIWQNIDNDINTEDEQKKDARKKLMDWLGEEISKSSNDPDYLTSNLDRLNFKYQKKY